MTALTDAEKAFLTMCKMTPIGDTIGMISRIARAVREDDFVPVARSFTQNGREPDHPWFLRAVEAFPIVASTFEALTIERPELREHYDRAREAWEASQ